MNEDVKLEIEKLSKKIDSMNPIRVYICPLCKNEVTELIEHHYSYFPEKIILVCRKCNNRSNLEHNHPLLNPPKKDGYLFRKKGKYAKKSSSRKKQCLSKPIGDYDDVARKERYCQYDHDVFSCEKCSFYPCNKIVSDGKGNLVFSGKVHDAEINESYAMMCDATLLIDKYRKFIWEKENSPSIFDYNIKELVFSEKEMKDLKNIIKWIFKMKFTKYDEILMKEMILKNSADIIKTNH